MNRAMFSGVAGLKTHQYRLDVIGNNIANVNTYGYKYQRAVFSDVFYQTLSGASAGTANRGGTNPTTVGYGSTLGSIQTMMTQSSMQNTGRGLDVAITGEGYLQVMDADGNIFYTKAGLLDYDANGYLVDMNGNFVLGATTTDGAPDTQRIKLDNVGAVEPAVPSVEEKINGVTYTIKGSKTSAYGNIGLTIVSNETLADDIPAQAIISNTGSVTIQLNANNPFSSLEDLAKAINDAVKRANGGSELPCGELSITADNANLFANGTLTGKQIAGQNFGVDLGSISGATKGFLDGRLNINKVSNGFTGEGAVSGLEAVYTEAAKDANGVVTTPAQWAIKMTINSVEYTGTLKDGSTASTMLLMKDGTTLDDDDYIELNKPSFSAFTEAFMASSTPPAASVNTGDKWADTTYDYNNAGGTGAPPAPPVASKSAEAKDLGFSTKTFTLTGGTEGGPVTLDQLTGISIGADGTVSVTRPDEGVISVGKITLANFANPFGLSPTGKNYYTASANSGAPQLCDPGSGGTGALKSSALEMSNVDLSQEFADMITAQRGFQANSRVITVSDTMLEELINLKR